MPDSYIFLSHPLSAATPGFGGKPVFKSTSKKSIASGDSCNQQLWELDNHGGTHIDVPHHFVDEGRAIDAYSAAEFVFNHIAYVEMSLEVDHLLGPTDFEQVELSPDSDLLLINSGFEKWRERETYWEHNPGVLPELADYLRAKCPKLRAIGFDFISLTGYQNRPIGRTAHQAFLSGTTPICIIEDMSFRGLTKPPKQVIISPLRVIHADGAPCTVFAKL